MRKESKDARGCIGRQISCKYFPLQKETHVELNVSHCLQSLYDCESVLSEDDEAARKNSIPPGTASCINKFNDEFLTSMSDDLHTPVVLAAMSDPLKTINDLIHTQKVF